MQTATKGTPEFVLKRAFDFARGLHYGGAPPEEYLRHLDAFLAKQDLPQPLQRYLRAGFNAGYFGNPEPDVLGVNSGMHIRLSTKPLQQKPKF